MARCAHMHNRTCSSLYDGKNFWNEMWCPGLIPKVSDAQHGFSPDELNLHFANISISPKEDSSESFKILKNSSPEKFAFRKVSRNDVVLAVSHFRSQAKGEDGIPQSIVAKALPTIVNYLTKLFSASLTKGIFPVEWKSREY